MSISDTIFTRNHPDSSPPILYLKPVGPAFFTRGNKSQIQINLEKDTSLPVIESYVKRQLRLSPTAAFDYFASVPQEDYTDSQGEGPAEEAAEAQAPIVNTSGHLLDFGSHLARFLKYEPALIDEDNKPVKTCGKKEFVGSHSTGGIRQCFWTVSAFFELILVGFVMLTPNLF